MTLYGSPAQFLGRQMYFRQTAAPRGPSCAPQVGLRCTDPEFEPSVHRTRQKCALEPSPRQVPVRLFGGKLFFVDEDEARQYAIEEYRIRGSRTAYFGWRRCQLRHLRELIILRAINSACSLNMFEYHHVYNRQTQT